MLAVLIVGCGNIAGGFDAARPEGSRPFTHAGAYRMHGGFRLLACVDPDAGRRREFQQRWQVEHAFASLGEALGANLQFDVVSICSPTAQHAADLQAALAARPRLVFCEKPLTSSLQDSEWLAVQYRQAGIALMVNYTRRFDERVRTLAAQLHRGEWGLVRSASAVYNKGLVNNGSHMLDMLRLLFGPLRVLAAGPATPDMWAADPSIAAMLVSDNGVTITLNCGDARDYSLFEFEIVTERGTIRMENGGLDWQVRRCGPSPVFAGYQALGASVHEAGTLDCAALAAVEQAASVLAGEATPSCTAEDAVAVQKLCEVIRAQSQSLPEGQSSA